jgi:hypothetical protein
MSADDTLNNYLEQIKKLQIDNKRMRRLLLRAETVIEEDASWLRDLCAEIRAEL